MFSTDCVFVFSFGNLHSLSKVASSATTMLARNNVRLAVKTLPAGADVAGLKSLSADNYVFSHTDLTVVAGPVSLIAAEIVANDYIRFDLDQVRLRKYMRMRLLCLTHFLYALLSYKKKKIARPRQPITYAGDSLLIEFSMQNNDTAASDAGRMALKQVTDNSGSAYAFVYFDDCCQ